MRQIIIQMAIQLDTFVIKWGGKKSHGLLTWFHWFIKFFLLKMRNQKNYRSNVANMEYISHSFFLLKSILTNKWAPDRYINFCVSAFVDVLEKTFQTTMFETHRIWPYYPYAIWIDCKHLYAGNNYKSLLSI